MIINRTTQYTLQVMMHLVAHPSSQPVLARELAEQLRIPSPYLAKLLQLPCRAGWLSSTRGRGGGYTLTPGAKNITLLEILILTRGERVSRECLLGFKECDDKTACVMHCHWKPIKRELLGQFGGYTLAQLATPRKRPPGLLPGKKPIKKPARSKKAPLG
jgi:Rrf2 family protein